MEDTQRPDWQPRRQKQLQIARAQGSDVPSPLHALPLMVLSHVLFETCSKILMWRCLVQPPPHSCGSWRTILIPVGCLATRVFGLGHAASEERPRLSRSVSTCLLCDRWSPHGAAQRGGVFTVVSRSRHLVPALCLPPMCCSSLAIRVQDCFLAAAGLGLLKRSLMKQQNPFVTIGHAVRAVRTDTWRMASSASCPQPVAVSCRSPP